MASKVLSLVIISIMLLSCGDDAVNINMVIDEVKTINDRAAINCLEGIEIDSATYQSNCPIVMDSSRYCEKIFIEEPIYFEDQDRSWISKYCSDIDDIYYYTNASDDTISMTIIDKGLFYSVTNFDVENECSDDKELMHVSQFESAKIVSKFSHLEGELDIVLSQKIEVQNGAVKNAPRILMNYDIGALTYVPMVFHFSTGNIDNLDTQEVEFIEMLEIDHAVFFDVYTDNRDNTGDLLKIYYNEAYGIVSFIDKDNMQWTLSTD